MDVKTGQKFSDWTVLDSSLIKKKKGTFVLCRCICDKEKEVEIRSLVNGLSKRCFKCGYKVRAEHQKFSQEEVDEIFEKEGCLLLETYKNNRTPVKYRCSCGNISKIALDNFKGGSRCKECGDKITKDKEKFSYSYVYKLFANGGCELLETDYINNRIPMKYRCSCGNISKITLHSFKNQGSRCNKCRIERISGKNSVHYNHNAFDEYRIKRRHLEGNSNWIVSVYKDFDFTCVNCGRSSVELNAHHLYGYLDHPELRLEKLNGVCLCKECHILFHSIYGKINNTPKQFIDFLKGEI